MRFHKTEKRVRYTDGPTYRFGSNVVEARQGAVKDLLSWFSLMIHPECELGETSFDEPFVLRIERQHEVGTDTWEMVGTLMEEELYREWMKAGDRTPLDLGDGYCPYCGDGGHHTAEACPDIIEIEYHEDGKYKRLKRYNWR